MASLKDLKIRIASVKSTQKITKAMKMVAAAKLRRATERAEAARPYAERMTGVMAAVASKMSAGDAAPKLLVGTGREDTHILVVMTSDRGLCGGFNSSIVRAAKQKIALLQGQGKTVKIICVGRKGFDQLALLYRSSIIHTIRDLSKKNVFFADAQDVANAIFDAIEKENADVVSIVYNKFKSAISQEVTFQQLMPLEIIEAKESAVSTVYEFEPEEEAIMADLLPRNFTVQIFRALLENSASEQGARMSAMDNATRNAGDMIGRLSQQYNRTRQAAITTELTEIISGAEAL